MRGGHLESPLSKEYRGTSLCHRAPLRQCLGSRIKVSPKVMMRHHDLRPMPRVLGLSQGGGVFLTSEVPL